MRPSKLPLLMACHLLAAPIAIAQSGARGFVSGVSLGIARTSLRTPAIGSARSGLDFAFGWRVGYRASERVAVMLQGVGAGYRSLGPGRPRRRGFEALVPTVEVALRPDTWISTGVGMHLDAPVFFDLQRDRPDERRYHRGWGMVLGAGYVVDARRPSWSRTAVAVEGRWHVGVASTPEGSVRGHSTALLVGARQR